MNLAQEAADALYQKSEEGEVSLADVVARFRNAWGEQGVATIARARPRFNRNEFIYPVFISALSAAEHSADRFDPCEAKPEQGYCRPAVGHTWSKYRISVGLSNHGRMAGNLWRVISGRPADQRRACKGRCRAKQAQVDETVCWADSRTSASKK